MPRKGIFKKFITSVFAGSLVVAMTPAFAVPAAWAQQDGASHSSEENSSVSSDASDGVIITYSQDVSKSEELAISSLCDRYGGTSEEITSVRGESGTRIVKVTVADGSKADALVEELQGTAGVARAQRNYVYHTMESANASDSDAASSTDDPSASQQYYLGEWDASASENAESAEGAEAAEGDSDDAAASAVRLSGANVRSAWALSKNAEQAGGDAAVTIAELDTGVDVNHEDLVDNIDAEHMGTVVSGEDGSYEVKPGVCEDVSSDGHGTHVAGVLAASANNGKGIAGVSYNARLLPVNVYYQDADDEDSASSASDDADDAEATSYVTDTAHLIAGLSYIQGLIDSDEVTNLRVVNMSLGSYSDEATESDYALEQAIKTLRDDYNVLTVCAGGNGDGDGNPMTDLLFPSDFDESLSVSWLDSDGKVAASADYNEHKDISAPGTDIYSTAASAENHSSYSSLSGSSMSAPIVSGAAALLWAKYPRLKVDEVKTSLQQSAHAIADAPDELGSAGAVDVAGALSYAEKHFAPNEKADISRASVSSTAFEKVGDWYLTYTGSALTPAFTLTVDGRDLKAGEDYTVVYTRNVSPGTATVTFTGKGDYRGVKTAHFDIVRDIGICSIAPVTAMAYTGSPIHPQLEVTDPQGNELVQGVDYVLQDFINTNVGQATIIVRGIGAYRSSLTTTFWIVERSADEDTKSVTVNTRTVTSRVLAGAVKSNTTTVVLGKNVTGISAGAFKDFPKVTSLVIKTKKLTKKSTKDALKGSKVKKVSVSLGSKKLNTQYSKKYEAYFS